MKSRLLQGPKMICTSVVDGAEKTKKKQNNNTIWCLWSLSGKWRGNFDSLKNTTTLLMK